jgi:uncharacterized membrane protein YfcA
MQALDPSRVQFVEAVVVGAVFSPTLLAALPFFSSAEASIAVVTLLVILLVVTLIGYFTYRKQVHASSSFHRWRVSLLLLLASAMLFTTAILAFRLGGFMPVIGIALLFLLLAAAAWKKMPRSRANAYKSNQAITGIAGALGAVSAGVLSVVFGPTFFQAVVATLHFSLAVVATILFIRASQEARSGQNAA